MEFVLQVALLHRWAGWLRGFVLPSLSELKRVHGRGCALAKSIDNEAPVTAGRLRSFVYERMGAWSHDVCICLAGRLQITTKNWYILGAMIDL